MSRLNDFRHRVNKRALALLAILAIALSGTGLASLALLEDTVTATVNGSITTIDLNVNGAKTTAINLEAGAIPGDFRYASLAFTNSGTGYVRVPSQAGIQSGAGDLTDDSAVKVWQGITPASCNATGLAGAPFTGAVPLSTPFLWDNEIQIDAGASLDVCLQYRLGTTGAVYTGPTAFQLGYTFAGYYP